MRNRVICCAALVGLAAGCGGPRTAVVRGAVSIDGEPITFGTVGFVGADGRVDTAMIRPDGTYEVSQAPVGPVVVTVQTYPLPPQIQPPPDPGAPAGKAGPAAPGGARYTPIPPRYGDDKQSPLRYTVEPRAQSHDIELTRKG